MRNGMRLSLRLCISFAIVVFAAVLVEAEPNGRHKKSDSAPVIESGDNWYALSHMLELYAVFILLASIAYRSVCILAYGLAPIQTYLFVNRASLKLTFAVEHLLMLQRPYMSTLALTPIQGLVMIYLMGAFALLARRQATRVLQYTVYLLFVLACPLGYSIHAMPAEVVILSVALFGVGCKAAIDIMRKVSNGELYLRKSTNGICSSVATAVMINERPVFEISPVRVSDWDTNGRQGGGTMTSSAVNAEAVIHPVGSHAGATGHADAGAQGGLSSAGLPAVVVPVSIRAVNDGLIGATFCVPGVAFVNRWIATRVSPNVVYSMLLGRYNSEPSEGGLEAYADISSLSGFDRDWAWLKRVSWPYARVVSLFYLWVAGFCAGIISADSKLAQVKAASPGSAAGSSAVFAWEIAEGSVLSVSPALLSGLCEGVLVAFALFFVLVRPFQESRENAMICLVSIVSAMLASGVGVWLLIGFVVKSMIVLLVVAFVNGSSMLWNSGVSGVAGQVFCSEDPRLQTDGSNSCEKSGQDLIGTVLRIIPGLDLSRAVSVTSCFHGSTGAKTYVPSVIFAGRVYTLAVDPSIVDGQFKPVELPGPSGQNSLLSRAMIDLEASCLTHKELPRMSILHNDRMFTMERRSESFDPLLGTAKDFIAHSSSDAVALFGSRRFNSRWQYADCVVESILRSIFSSKDCLHVVYIGARSDDGDTKRGDEGDGGEAKQLAGPSHGTGYVELGSAQAWSQA